MKLQDIPRVKAGPLVAVLETTTNEFSREQMALATRAKDVLGYSVLAEHATGRKSLGEREGKLSSALLVLDLQVLDSAKVLEYEMAEAGRLTLAKAQEEFKSWTTGYFYPAKWENTLLASYDKPIPEFVLDKALRIKDAVPEVQFYIQHLSEPKADPFLVAVLGREIYYIDAWDEPRFEKSL